MMNENMSVAPSAPVVTVNTPEFIGRLTCCMVAPSTDQHEEMSGLIAHIDAHTAAAVASERERAARLALQWSNARHPDHGGNALRAYAQALRDGVQVCDDMSRDYHWSKAPTAPAAPPGEWAEAERISNLPAVHDVIQGFADDPTGDGGTMIVREVMRALAKQAEAAPVGAEHRYFAIGKHIFVDDGDIGRSRVAEFYLESRADEFVAAFAERDQLRAALAQRAGSGEARLVGMVAKSSFGGHKVLVATAPLDDVHLGQKLYTAPPPQSDSARDAERLDLLEQMANEPEGLLLHDGGDFTGRRGLGLRRIGRSLRQAVDAMAAQQGEKGGT